MFNYNNRVRLSDFPEIIGVIRDAEFFACGKIPSKVPQRLIPASSSSHLRELTAYQGEIAAIVCTPNLQKEVPSHLGCAISENPKISLNQIHSILNDRKDQLWTDFPSKISPFATIHPKAHIDQHNVTIGPGTVIGPNSTIMGRVEIGEDCSVGSNTSIGTSAYEIIDIGDRSEIVAQAGAIVIGNGVHILSNVTIARSAYPSLTKIGNHSSFDNLTHIAHDCVLGERVRMAACSMLSGRVTIGNDVSIGPNATISNGLNIGDFSKITIGSVVVSDVQEGKTVTGNFAIDHRVFLRAMATMRKKNK